MVGGSMLPQAPGLPNHWHVYFGTDDADATAATAAEQGGAVIVPPFDIPVGRIAVLSDPQGAMFSIIKSTTEHTAETAHLAGRCHYDTQPCSISLSGCASSRRASC